MIERIKQWVTVLDLPSGVVMGLFTLVMIALCIASFVLKRDINGSIQAVYFTVSGLFSVHKTATAITQIKTETTTTGQRD